MYRLALSLVFLLLTLPVLAADPDPLDNWPQWRGPLMTGAGPRANPPVKWDDKTNVRWKTPIPGRGSATPIVWGDKIFLLTALDTGKPAGGANVEIDPKFERKTKPPKNLYRFLVLCLDRATGKILWERVATEQAPHEGIHPTHSYAAGSPVTDGRHLYASFGSRGVYCYDLDGNLKWQRDLGKMITRFGWGEGISPAAHGDTVVVNWDQEEGSFIVALDARTGATRWKADRDEPTSWSTPLVVTYGGKTQVVVNATKKVRSYDLASGKVLWECGGQTVNVIPTPVAQGGVVYCLSGYNGAAAKAIPLDATGDVTGSPKVLWSYARGTPYVPSPLLLGDRLYFTQGNTPQLTILDSKTGKPLVDRERLTGASSFYGSPVGAAGRVYFTSREGVTVVLKAGDKLETLAVNRLGEATDASPALVGKQLFLRGDKHLYCIEGE